MLEIKFKQLLIIRQEVTLIVNTQLMLHNF